MNPKKAPGEDGMTLDICYESYKTTPSILLAIYNKCLEIGYFPKIWKKAIIKIIPKPGKVDYTVPKAYRPIGLLPVFGKILEKLFVGRLLWQLGREGKFSNRQYGFMPQRSTEDALYDIMTVIKQGIKEKKIVMMVSLDIEGAFDNAWWPQIIKEIQRKNVNIHNLRLITSYLSSRSVIVKYAGAIATKPTTKGCIQGSTCGLILWNILLDPLLELSSDMDVHLQAFADDILIIAKGNSAKDVEDKLNPALEKIVTWGKTHKLNFAPHKTQSIVITKKLSYELPIIKMDKIIIQPSTSLKVLGATIDKNLNFVEHLDEVLGKAIKIYKMIARTAKAHWGLHSDMAELTAILKALDMMCKFGELKKGIILSDSRSALECLTDSSSLHPLAAEIRERIRSLVNKNGEVKFYWIKAHIGIPDNERADELAKKAALFNKQAPVYDKCPLSFAKRLTRDSTCVKWQQRYSEAATGAVTKNFFPDVREAHKTLKQIRMDNIKAQLLTGHGGFKAYLFKFKLAQSPSCVCSNEIEEKIEHLLIDCPRFTIQRMECEHKMGIAINITNLKYVINNDDCRIHFLKYAEYVVRCAGKANGSKVDI
ncbi:unnamed protein product [Parnassius mnemosyne]|uniref:Uncharacterized protein n=1 Tax=Parnassius mnemosyne TaxID=213953 RepID=A0AAV1LHV3_9NEOP